MVLDLSASFNRLHATLRRSSVCSLIPLPDHPCPLTHPDFPLPAWVADDPIVQEYRALLGVLPWAQFSERPHDRNWPGPRPNPRAPFVAAYLVKLHEGKRYMSDLRGFLLKHPALVYWLGFERVADPTAPHGFHGAATVPKRRHFSTVPRDLPNEALQFLLSATVQLLGATLPEEQQLSFGDTIAGDTQAILAGVRENNPDCLPTSTAAAWSHTSARSVAVRCSIHSRMVNPARSLIHIGRRAAGPLPEDEQAQRLVAEMWRRYRQGFVAYLQGDVRPRMQQLAGYLAKYVVSPPMALSRIVAYDREHGTVTYWYRDHQRGGQRTEETVSRETFIGRMVQHILPKGFQRIRYYGLQATCILKQVREQLALALHIAVQQAMDMLERPGKRPRYRERMRSTLGGDPLRCPRCGGDMSSRHRHRCGCGSALLRSNSYRRRACRRTPPALPPIQDYRYQL